VIPNNVAYGEIYFSKLLKKATIGFSERPFEIFNTPFNLDKTKHKYYQFSCINLSLPKVMNPLNLRLR
jgi:hypothetical protein